MRRLCSRSTFLLLVPGVVGLLLGLMVAFGEDTGMLVPWQRLPPLANEAKSLAVGTYDVVSVIDADGQVYLCVEWRHPTCWVSVSHRQINALYGAVGQRPCDLSQRAFQSYQRPTTIADCVQGLQGHPDGATAFIYVIDATNTIWAWSSTTTADTHLYRTSLLVWGSLGLIIGSVLVLVRSFLHLDRGS